MTNLDLSFKSSLIRSLPNFLFMGLPYGNDRLDLCYQKVTSLLVSYCFYVAEYWYEVCIIDLISGPGVMINFVYPKETGISDNLFIVPGEKKCARI